MCSLSKLVKGKRLKNAKQNLGRAVQVIKKKKKIEPHRFVLRDIFVPDNARRIC